MIAPRTHFGFDDGSLIAETPWADAAKGAVLVNGEPVQAEWAREEDGSMSCRHRDWRLVVI